MARAVEDICNMALGYAGVNARIDSIDDNSAQASACKTWYEEKRDQLLVKLRPNFAIVRKILAALTGNPYLSGTTFALGDMIQYGQNIYRSLQDNNIGNQPNLASSAAWWQQVTRDGYGFVYALPDDCLTPIAAWERPDTNGTNAVVFDSSLPSNSRIRTPRSDQRVPYALENSDDGFDTRVIISDLDTAVLRYVKRVENPNAFTSLFVDALAREMAGPLVVTLRSDPDKEAKMQGLRQLAAGEAWAADHREQQEDPEPVSVFESSREGS